MCKIYKVECLESLCILYTAEKSWSHLLLVSPSEVYYQLHQNLLVVSVKMVAPPSRPLESQLPHYPQPLPKLIWGQQYIIGWQAAPWSHRCYSVMLVTQVCASGHGYISQTKVNAFFRLISCFNVLFISLFLYQQIMALIAPPVFLFFFLALPSGFIAHYIQLWLSFQNPSFVTSGTCFFLIITASLQFTAVPLTQLNGLDS